LIERFLFGEPTPDPSLGEGINFFIQNIFMPHPRPLPQGGKYFFNKKRPAGLVFALKNAIIVYSALQDVILPGTLTRCPGLFLYLF
jgi:hypothetical protein